jgi:son of sevenless-like protein
VRVVLAVLTCCVGSGIYLTDLTFIEDGNKDMLGSLINFFKRRLIYEVILEVQQYQQQGYNLLEVPQLQDFILSAEVLPQPSFQEVSLRLEPRGAERSDIA